MSRKWMRLDNAALIFPAIRQRHWVNVFRLSATLNEPIDPATLQAAVDDLKPRFPSMYVRLKTGLFWYYLEEIPGTPQVREDYAYPLVLMQEKELHACCLRVTYFQNRIAVEFFHSLTDGNGGLVFLKTLTARYLERRTGARIPAGEGVLDWQDKPAPEELEDSFQKHANKYVLNDKEPAALHVRGTYEPNFLHLLTGRIPADALLDAAHRYGATVTVFLAAVLAESLLQYQQTRIGRDRRRPVKITVPVNLRKLYGSRTLRNFILTLNPGVDPRMGTYTLPELCKTIGAQIAAEATPQRMSGRIAANVSPQQVLPIRLAPLPVKNLVMRLVYSVRGERCGCLTLSNLGVIRLPAEMGEQVARLEFIIGPQITYPHNCGVATWNGTTYINFIRNIRECELERLFFSRLVELGLPVHIESNDPR